MTQQGWQTSFEDYRRERTFRRLQSAGPQRPLGSNAAVLQQLEAAEQQEVSNERLTKEVHDFFSDATRTAAGIVQKISVEQEEDTERKLGLEMEDFLGDVVQRAESFLFALQSSRPVGSMPQSLEPQMRHLSGAKLEELRQEAATSRHFEDQVEAAEAAEQATAEPIAVKAGSVPPPRQVRAVAQAPVPIFASGPTGLPETAPMAPPFDEQSAAALEAAAAAAVANSKAAAPGAAPAPAGPAGAELPPGRLSFGIEGHERAADSAESGTGGPSFDFAPGPLSFGTGSAPAEPMADYDAPAFAPGPLFAGQGEGQDEVLQPRFEARPKAAPSPPPPAGQSRVQAALALAAAVGADPQRQKQALASLVSAGMLSAAEAQEAARLLVR